jgi:Flp pilus assembly protein TadD
MAKHSKSKSKPQEGQGKFWLQVALIGLAVLCVYWPALCGDWLWDDDLDISGNVVITNPMGWWTIWFSPSDLVDFYPLKNTVQLMEWQLFGLETLGYHLVNVFLHILGACLVWRLLSKFNLKYAWLGGLLFALHPANVESVAWMAELKNTLSLPPFLLAMCAWIDYDARGERRDYFKAWLLFLVAMLCKSTMVMFPVVILLYAWWKRGRIGRHDLKVSAPFFALSLLLGIITVLMQNTHVLQQVLQPGEVLTGGPLSRLAGAGQALSTYFLHVIAPEHLMPIYPQWPTELSPLPFLPWVFMGGLFYACWRKRKTWGRHVLLGFGFFLITLAPFLGLNATAYMKFTPVMDHFLYIPMIGLIGLVMAGFGLIQKRLSPASRPVGLGVAATVLAFFAWESFSYAAVWVNHEALWSHTLEYYPDSWLAHRNLGNVWMRAGRLPEAVAEFQRAIAIKPDYAEAHSDLATTLQKGGRMPEAAGEFEATLKIDPRNLVALNNLGVICWQDKKWSEAETYFKRAAQASPDDVDVLYNLGLVFLQENRAQDAVEQYEQALRIDPHSVNVQSSLGDALIKLHRWPEAQEAFEEVLRLEPGDGHAMQELGQLQGFQITAPAAK